MDFLERLFGANEGQLCIVTINGSGAHDAHYFDYPCDLAALSESVNEWANTKQLNVYFYPMLVDGYDAGAEIIYEPVIATDLDMVDPVLLSPRPDMIVESSGGRFQAYWKSENFEDGELPSSVSGPIANDLKLKRLPSTKNWKYKRGVFEVREVDPASLDNYDKVVARRHLTGNSYDYLFGTNDRWSLARLCARLGCGTSEVFLVLQAAQRATGVVVGSPGYVSTSKLYKDATEAVRVSLVPSLLTAAELRQEAERTNGNGNGHTGSTHTESFIDKYLDWATKCTDAPRQYHVAGALTVLSSLLSPLIRFPTSFTTYRPNLWFMILGMTTLSRKTTAMEMAIRTAKCVAPDVLMATDGSPEGILTSLSKRDGKGSIFFKDEVSGFLGATKSKQYMSDFLEMLTRLYDGGGERRTLRKQVIEVEDPHLVLLFGGIRDATIDLLDTEHLASGFLLRFLVVTGSTRVEDMKPIGPPEESTLELVDVLNDYLSGLAEHYSPKVKNPFSVSAGPSVVNFTATDEAWDRIKQLEDDARRFGMGESNTDIFCPLMDRIKNSVIKVALLLAADRAFREDSAHEIMLQDVVTAISHSNVWIESAYEVASGIDDKPSRDELRNIKIEVAISSAQEGMTRTDVMRRFRLSKKDMDAIEATLEDRGQLVITTVNRTKVYRSPAREA